MSKSIRVEDDAHAALAALKGEDETIDETLSWFIEERREGVRDGAGLWEGTDTCAGRREQYRATKDRLRSTTCISSRTITRFEGQTSRIELYLDVNSYY